MPERYLDPKNDLTFKKVFGEHAELLRSFLNAVLPLDGREIVHLEYLPPELVPDIPIHKNTIVDVRCKDENGRVFIVEMQMIWTDSFMQRVLFNASKAYVRQIPKGGEYKYLNPVYSLNLLDDTFSDSDEYLHHYRIVNIANTEQRIKGLEFIFIELPKFRPDPNLANPLHDRWLRFLTEVSEETAQLSTDLLEAPEIREALEMVRESAFTAGELEAYEKYWDTIRTERTYLADALAEGREEGAKVKALEIAHKLQEAGIPAEQIISLTGISPGDLI